MIGAVAAAGAGLLGIFALRKLSEDVPPEPQPEGRTRLEMFEAGDEHVFAIDLPLPARGWRWRVFRRDAVDGVSQVEYLEGLSIESSRRRLPTREKAYQAGARAARKYGYR